MPFTIAWHEPPPALIITYSGELTLSEYRQLVKQRHDLLQKKATDVVIVADLRGFGGFPDASALHDSVLAAQSDNVRATLFVVDETHNKRLLRSVVHDPERHMAAYWFADMDQALHAAQEILS